MSKSTILIVSSKKWNSTLADALNKKFQEFNWILISNHSEFTEQKVLELDPIKIFIPHWSHIIPASIFNNYECILFHMTDLPFGRGGSPLQNLIIRGLSTTKISAIKVEEEIDSGDVYLKHPLELSGTAEQIFYRSNEVILTMIEEIMIKKIKPKVQVGNVVKFKRRTPEESNLIGQTEIKKVYDFIRMLDCDGYPPAFINLNDLKIEFKNAKFDDENNIIEANVRILKK